MFGHKAETYELKNNTSKKWGRKKQEDNSSPVALDEPPLNADDLPLDELDTVQDYAPMQEEAPMPAQKGKKAKKAKKPKSELPFWHDKKKIGIILVSASLLVMLVISPLLNYLTTTKMSTAVVAKADIKQGTLITDEMLAAVAIPEAAMLPVFIRDKLTAVGKYAQTDIVKDEQISEIKLSTTLPFNNNYLYALNENKKALSISISSLAAGLSGKLQSGDIITLYANIPKSESEGNDVFAAKLFPELAYLRVLSVTGAEGFDTAPVTQAVLATKEEAAQSEALPATITLEVDDIQACTLAGLEQNGEIHAALVSRGKEDFEKSLLIQQDDYLAQQKLLNAARAESEKELGPAAPPIKSIPTTETEVK